MKKISNKRRESLVGRRVELEKMWNFFLNIWHLTDPKRRRCENCGRHLGDEPLSYMFDHLLEKETYPELKFEKDNIFLCCLECHTNKTNGHPGEKHKKAIEKAKIDFN